MLNGNAHGKNNDFRNNFINLIYKRQMFVLFILLFAFLILMTNNNLFLNNYAFAENEPTENVEEELKSETSKVIDGIDFSELNDAFNELDFDFDLFGGKGFKEFVVSVIEGGETINIASFFNILLASLRNSIKKVLSPLFLILIVVLLCSMFNNIRSGKISGVGEVVYLVCFSVVVIIVSTISSQLIVQTKTSLSQMQRQMNAIFPILLSLMTVMGGVVTVKAYTPMLAFFSNVISNIFVYVLLPIFSLSLVLAIIGNISPNTKLSKLGGFVSSLFKWIAGTTFAVFMAFLSLQGITAGAADGISIKATKFAIKNYIPLLGGYISDGFELVKAGGLIVKNATGFAGILLLFATIIVPVVSIAIIELGLKLLAGVIEPIGDSQSANLLYSIAKSLKLLVAIIVGVALMYFLTIFLITCSISNII